MEVLISTTIGEKNLVGILDCCGCETKEDIILFDKMVDQAARGRVC